MLSAITLLSTFHAHTNTHTHILTTSFYVVYMLKNAVSEERKTTSFCRSHGKEVCKGFVEGDPTLLTHWQIQVNIWVSECVCEGGGCQ